MFQFVFCYFRIDATDREALAKWVNDDHKTPNCVMKKITLGNSVHLCLFATRDIGIGEELRYVYGGLVSTMPWRQVS